MPNPKTCSVHAQRPAFAVCMTCAKTLCQECATQWDGIWHCASCLGAKRAVTVKHSAAAGWISIAAATALLLYFSARLMVWTGALIAGLF
ncbi:MAG TPA: hypothetical protein VFN10_24040 [Thermoanaerobaculia bacterium]|nr:hypothetical protein [Thermoanaerobaculia bacterium]